MIDKPNRYFLVSWVYRGVFGNSVLASDSGMFERDTLCNDVKKGSPTDLQVVILNIYEFANKQEFETFRGTLQLHEL